MPTLNLFILGLALTSLVNCTIPLKDSKFYADAGPDGAYWFMSLSKGQGHLSQADWDKARFGMICETPEVFANLKEVIETLCANTNECTYEQQQQERQFYTKLQAAIPKPKAGH